MSRLIGLIGKARVGKNTVGDYLYAEYNYKDIAFAEPIKMMLRAAFPEVDFNAGDREAQIDWLGKSPRQLMQTLGSEWGREQVHPDLWVMLAERRIDTALNAGWPGVVITDVRFPNEADMILRRGGVLIEILRPDTTPVANHASEQQDLSGFPRHIIHNTGTIDDLRRSIDTIMGKVCPQ